MAFDYDGFSDFGTGAFQGAEMGNKLAPKNPYAMAGGALLMGGLSYFGGTGQRRLERKANQKALEQMDQSLELGTFSVAEARRNDKAAREAEKRRKRFGEMLSRYFQGGK